MDRKEYMLSQVESWKQSGITQQAFCDKAGIKLATFGYWVDSPTKIPRHSALKVVIYSGAKYASQTVLYHH